MASPATHRPLPRKRGYVPDTARAPVRASRDLLRPSTDYGLKERFRSTLPEMPGTVPLAEYCQIWKS